MLKWLDDNGGWLLAGVFVAMVTAGLIALKDGARGHAVLVSIMAGSVLTGVLYPLLGKFNYGPEFSPLLGLICGGVGMGVFGVLTSVGKSVENRKERLADGIVDKVAGERKP